MTAEEFQTLFASGIDKLGGTTIDEPIEVILSKKFKFEGINAEKITIKLTPRAELHIEQ